MILTQNKTNKNSIYKKKTDCKLVMIIKCRGIDTMKMLYNVTCVGN